MYVVSRGALEVKGYDWEHSRVDWKTIKFGVRPAVFLASLGIAKVADTSLRRYLIAPTRLINAQLAERVWRDAFLQRKLTLRESWKSLGPSATNASIMQFVRRHGARLAIGGVSIICGGIFFSLTLPYLEAPFVVKGKPVIDMQRARNRQFKRERNERILEEGKEQGGYKKEHAMSSRVGPSG